MDVTVDEPVLPCCILLMDSMGKAEVAKGQPKNQPTVQPSEQPLEQSAGEPISDPTGQPSSNPTSQPPGKPMVQPTEQPTSQPVVVKVPVKNLYKGPMVAKNLRCYLTQKRLSGGANGTPTMVFDEYTMPLVDCGRKVGSSSNSSRSLSHCVHVLFI